MSLRIYKIGVLLPNTNLVDLAVILNDIGSTTNAIASMRILIDVQDVVLYRSAGFTNQTGTDITIGQNTYGVDFDANDQLQLVASGAGVENIKIAKISDISVTELVNITDLALVIRDKAGVELTYLVGRILTDVQDVVLYKLLLTPKAGSQTTFKLGNKTYTVEVLSDGTIQVSQA